MTIPRIYGVTQTNLMVIWAANLRQGNSGKKGKGGGKKSTPTYIENIDFLIGQNPVLGVLQTWNNGGLAPLNFASYSITGTDIRSITIADSNFYAVIGVSVAAPYSQTFNDYGSAGPDTVSGTYQIPFWNSLMVGPDPTHGSAVRNWPFCYRWKPSYGNVLYIDSPGLSGIVTVYYAQLTAATSNQPPIQRLYLSFEPALGDGDAYEGYSSQQIIYPMFTGLGSN